ncbi:MAG: branched-chain-amino-acid transaminase [Caldisericaceae bacterium]
MEAKYIYFKGEFVPWNDAKIHILSHVVQYGSGVFEGIRCYNTKNGPAIFRAYDHYKRLQESMKSYRMEIPETIEDLIQITKELLIKNDLKDAYIRPIVYRGLGEISPNPLPVKVELSIAAFAMGGLFEESEDKGVNVMVSSWRRFAPDTLPSLAKATGNYLNSELAMIEAEENGFDEAIMLDIYGFVAEGPGENVFVVKDSTLYTPTVTSSILKGITRDSVNKIAEKLGIKVVEEHMPREMLYAADEAFFSGTAAEITPIVSVDRRKIGTGKLGEITKRIRDEFRKVTYAGEDPFDWLEYVDFEAM